MKKSLKWLAVVLCVAIVAVTFVSCGGNAPASDKVYNVGISQLVQHPALDAATQGFQDKLTELLGEDHVKFDVQNGAGEDTVCATIANQFVASKVDLIMANATPALTAAVSATSEIPIVGTSITDYGTALDMELKDGKTGINVTGISDLAPLDKQADMFSELLPEAKKIGILFCSGEANSRFQVDGITKYLTEKGLEVVEYSFADTNDLAAVTTKACGECDAIYIPTDNTAAKSTELINNIAEPAKTPIIAAEEGICKGCGFATLSINYYEIGEKAAQQAYEILVNGANPAEMEIGDAGVKLLYLKSRAETLGITIPDTYEAIEEA